MVRTKAKLPTDVLKIEGIITRTPSPGPQPQQRAEYPAQSAGAGFNDLDTYEVERLAREQHRAAYSTQSAIPRFNDLDTYEVERLARERHRQLKVKHSGS